jgi:Na+-transporting methylmalonyl-CoA/oxaloacetate decarboxylase gamma subunit
MAHHKNKERIRKATKMKSTKQKRAALKGIIVIIFLILILAVIFIGSKLQKKSGTIEEKPVELANAKEPAKANEPAKELSTAELEQIKMDIITGKREDVPPGFNEPKTLIIGQYLHDCYVMTNVNEKIACYELYYLNNDALLKQQKEDCEKLSGNQRTECLDEFYYEMANSQEGGFCDAIINDALRSNCKEMG